MWLLRKPLVVKSSIVCPSKRWPVKSFCKNPIALRSSARLLSPNISLVEAALACELAEHCSVIGKFVDVRPLHVLVLYVLVIWLELRLNPRHFCTHLQLFLSVQLGLQMLTHVPWILTLKYLFVHEGSLALKCYNVWVISLFSNSF